MTGPDTLRVVLCDDALAYPMMVQSWFKRLPGMDLVAQCATAEELEAALDGGRVDVVLLDVVLSGGEVDRALVQRVRAAGARVVLVSSFPPDELAVIAERLGADAWCAKSGGEDGLLVALQQL